MPIICTPRELVEHNVMWEDAIFPDDWFIFDEPEIVATSEELAVSTPAETRMALPHPGTGEPQSTPSMGLGPLCDRPAAARGMLRSLAL